MQVKLPENVGAEQAILGALLLKDSILFDLGDEITADDFADLGHAAIFRTIESLVFGGKRASSALVRDYLGATDPRVKLDESYLDSLTGAVASLTDTVHYARQVADLARRRRLMLAMMEGVGELGKLDPQTPSQAVIDKIETDVLSASRVDERSVKRLGDWARKSVARVIDAMDRPNALTSGFSWGLAATENVAGRFMPGTLVVLGGRPGSGKSLAAGMFAESFGAQGPGAIISLEMSGSEYSERLMALHADIPAWRINEARLNEAEIDRLQIAADRLRALPVWIDERPKLNIEQIRARAIRYKHKYNIQWLICDHIHIVAPVTRRQDKLDLTNEVAFELKQMSKDLQIGVLGLAQLNRGVRDRDDGRPRASDLMFYSAIEPHADSIIFTHRPELALAERKPDPSNDRAFADWKSKMEMAEGKAEFINSKRRQGKAYLSCECHFDGPSLRFRDLQEKPRKSAQQEMDEIAQ
jgi:replicative DNA helicase